MTGLVNLDACLAKIKSHSPVIPDATRQFFIAAAQIRKLVGRIELATKILYLQRTIDDAALRTG